MVYREVEFDALKAELGFGRTSEARTAAAGVHVASMKQHARRLQHCRRIQGESFAFPRPDALPKGDLAFPFSVHLHPMRNPLLHSIGCKSMRRKQK